MMIFLVKSVVDLTESTGVFLKQIALPGHCTALKDRVSNTEPNPGYFLTFSLHFLGTPEQCNFSL